jgi:hypothetical protein
MARSVFLSYSHHDNDIALGVVAALEASGVDVWIAPRDVIPGAEWAAEIIDAISAARVMVLVFSSHSNDSPQVRREIERAVHKQVSILPFRTEPIQPSKSLEYFLSAQHWLDAFPPPYEAYYPSLCRHVRDLLGLPPSAAAGPGPPAAASESWRPAAAFAARELELLERQFAYHVGPIAAHLVRRAASEARDWDDLRTRLAQEIESVAERQQFLKSLRGLTGL